MSSGQCKNVLFWPDMAENRLLRQEKAIFSPKKQNIYK
jgi:hypothetical protein